jgi:hypothetical protein
MSSSMDTAHIDRNADETIDSETAAVLLHCDDSQTVESLARKGIIPGTKFGKSWIFLRSQLVDCIRDKASAEAEVRRGGMRPSEREVEDLGPGAPAPRRGRGRPRGADLPVLPTLEEVRKAQAARQPAEPPKHYSATAAVTKASAPGRSRASSRSA